MRNRCMIGVLAAIVAGCTSTAPVEPALEAAAARADGLTNGARTITVMTRNLYVGADVDAVIAALLTGDPGIILNAMAVANAQFHRTDFPARAQAIADEIAAARPEVVGLQELTLMELDLTGLGLPISYQVEFAPVLMAALAERGLDYHLVTVENIDVDVGPMLGPATVHLVDWDGMLIRGDLYPAATVTSGNYTACLGPSPCLGGPFTIKRGWIRAAIPVNGMMTDFVSTHLESGSGLDVSYVRALQLAELLDQLGTASPVVLMGDLNEEEGVDLVPGVPGVYEMLMAAGFTDLWREMRPGTDGLTCCHAADLSDKLPSGFDQRIDYVLTRGFGRTGPGLQGQIAIVGRVPSSRLAGAMGTIWPSDHAGLVASLLFPPAWAGTR